MHLLEALSAMKEKVAKFVRDRKAAPNLVLVFVYADDRLGSMPEEES
jgi:hypothetical protein